MKCGTIGCQTGVYEIGWVELFRAVFALIATGVSGAAVGASALDIAVGQETAVSVGVDLGFTILDARALVSIRSIMVFSSKRTPCLRSPKRANKPPYSLLRSFLLSKNTLGFGVKPQVNPGHPHVRGSLSPSVSKSRALM